MSTSDAPRGPGAAPEEGFASSLEQAAVSQSQLLAAPSSRFGGPGRVVRRLLRRLLSFHVLPQARFNASLLDAMRGLEPRFVGLERGVSRVDEHLSRFEERLSRIEERLSGLGEEQKAWASRQEGFEGPALDRIGNIERHLSDLGNDLAADFATLRASLHAQGRQVDEVGGELVATTADLESIKEEWEDAKKEQIVIQSRVRTLEQRFEPLTSMDHFDFARRYRGDPDAIRQRLRTYAQFFGEVERVLDFGCGRGEFLEICGEMKIGAYGVDSDPDMISHCKLRRVDGIVGNALEHMRKLPNRSLDGIFSAQVVEHLTPAELVELIQLASDKLKRGGRIVIETINPNTFSALRWFFLDPTHCQPVPAEMLRFFLEEAKFRVHDILYTSPVPEDEKLALLAELGLEGSTPPELLRVLDENSRRLNEAIFGPQDYAIFAER